MGANSNQKPEGKVSCAEGMATAGPLKPGKGRERVARTPQKMKLGKTQNKLKILFGRYAANLKLYCSALPGQFLCPLCFHGFPVESIEWGHLSLAHVVPEVLGGRMCTLLCKACNNTLGNGIEGHADRRRKIFDALSGKTRKGASLGLRLHCGADDAIELQADCKADREKGIFHVEFNADRNNPRAFENSLQLMQASSAQGTPVQLDIRNPDNYRDQIANLVDYSIAYHALFSLMGYEFVFSKLGLALREVVCLPDEYANIPAHYVQLTETDFVYFETGDVVLVDSSLGVVMPDIEPAPPRRILLLGALIDPISIPWAGQGGSKEARIRRFIYRKDEQHLPMLLEEKNPYHRMLKQQQFLMHWSNKAP